MGYKVKWIEDHLGITRKAIRVYEEMGLLPKNLNGRCREFSDSDLEQLWMIKLLQGIGFSLKDILRFVNDDGYDFDTALKGSIERLEKEKKSLELYLGYAKSIKFYGHLPAMPKDFGSVKFEEFHDKSVKESPVNNNALMSQFTEITDLVNSNPEDWTNAELRKVMDCFLTLAKQLENYEALLTDTILPKEIIKRKNKGPKDPEVQLLVKMIYENVENMLPEIPSTPPLDVFTKIEAWKYLYGDIGKIQEKQLGKEGCKFIADAIAVFGGYSGYEELLELGGIE